jgi:hypothetical protein
MKSTEIKTNVQNLIDNFSKEEFIYDLLIAYGISKTSVTRLKKGDYNFAKADGEILYKKKIFFKVESTDKLLSSIEEISKDERILKHKPRFVILTDYKQIVAKDLKVNKLPLDIKLKELPNYFDFFLPLAGSEIYNAKNDDEADRNASYKMADLYDLLIEENPQIYKSKASIHNLNIFLSRLLFCYFSEDTDIFEENIFTNTLAQHTDENGKDTHTFLDDLFDRLNDKKADTYPDYLAKFPYVNGGLFNDNISSPVFTTKARKTLIDLGELQWKDINPDIFGSMIQAVVIPEYRSDLGMHYTSVENILKLIKPLFLDELYEAFETSASSVPKLRKLINRISKIKFFDPACGSGNFLIITYKEIRLLEILILEKITDLEGNAPTIKWTSIQLSQFYGIEIDDFAHEMAILSLWLAEHQMNRVFEDVLFDFGKSKSILPLKEAGQITQSNATREDWKTVCPIAKNDEVYIIGNPPYLGYKGWDSQQKKDMAIVFSEFSTVNRLDFISCWFKKGTDYIKGNNSKLAFVSTNSICQGEQVSLIWPYILNNVEINFAYTSFSWSNSAKGNAGVSVIIISLANKNKNEKIIFSDNRKVKVKNINPYLTGGDNIYINKRNNPISQLPKMALGSSGIDGGNLILSKEEKETFISRNSNSKKFIKKFLGGNDFLNGVERHCLWIDDDKIDEASKIESIKDRIDKCEVYRLNAGRDARKASDVPHRFFYRKYQEKESLIVPFTSSGNRTYLPIGIEKKDTIISNGMLVVYNFEPYIFGLLSSKLHMIWSKAVGGKMREDIRYSVSLIYNTFPFPEITTKQKETLNLYVFAILDERAKHNKTIAQMYHPLTMPKGLLQAHQELDTAI